MIKHIIFSLNVSNIGLRNFENYKLAWYYPRYQISVKFWKLQKRFKTPNSMKPEKQNLGVWNYYPCLRFGIGTQVMVNCGACIFKIDQL